MFDKYKRYRERRNEGRVAVKLEYTLFPRTISNLPTSITQVCLTFARESKRVEFPGRPVHKGSASWLEPIKFVCTVYRDAVQASVCELKEYEVWVDGTSPTLEKLTVAGLGSVDFANYAFKGAQEQHFSLHVPAILSKKGQDLDSKVMIILHATIVATTPQKRQVPSPLKPAIAPISAAGRMDSMSSISIASGLSSGSSAHSAKDQGLPGIHPGPTSTAFARQGEGATANQPETEQPTSRSTSAMRISTAQCRLMEKAALLSRSPRKQLPGPGMNSSAPLQGTHPNTTEGHAPIEEDDLPFGDIVLDAEALNISMPPAPLSMTNPKLSPATTPSELAIPGAALAQRIDNRKLSGEPSEDSLSEIDLSEPSMVVDAPRQPRRSAGLVKGTISIWDNGWSALTSSKAKKGKQSSAGAIKLNLRTPSNVMSTFGKTSRQQQMPMPRAEDLPYSSSSSEHIPEEEAATNTHHYLAEQVVTESNGAPEELYREERDDNHMQRITAAASLLRSARLSMQASVYPLSSSSRNLQRAPSGLSTALQHGVQDSSRALQPGRQPDIISLSQRQEGKPSGTETATQGTRSKRQQRLQRAQQNAFARKAAAEEQRVEVSPAEEGQQKEDANEDRHGLLNLVAHVSEDVRSTAARAERLTNEAIKIAAEMEEKQVQSARRSRLTRTSQSPRPTEDPTHSFAEEIQQGHAPPGRKAQVEEARPLQKHTSETPPAAQSWEAARDQRKLKELQLELSLAEERIAFLEANLNSAAMGSQLRRNLNRNTSLHRLSRSSSWKEPSALSGTLSSSREVKLSQELQEVRTCLVEMDRCLHNAAANVPPNLLQALQAALSYGAEHAAAAKELAELLKTDVLGSAHTAEVWLEGSQRNEEKTCRKSALAALDGPKSVAKKLGGTEKLIRKASMEVSTAVKERQKLATSHSSEVERLATELKEAQEALLLVAEEKKSLQAYAKQSEARLAEESEACQARLASALDEGAQRHALQANELEQEVCSLRGAVQQRDQELANMKRLLDMGSPAGAGIDGQPQTLAARLHALLERLTRLQDDNQRLLQTSSKHPKDKEAGQLVELERKLAESHLTNEQLQKEMELMRRENGEDATSMAVKLAVAAKEAEIVRLQRQMGELEEAAQAELGDMHEELLEMRQACHDLELALNKSEAKREKMQLEQQQMEQHLQETAGELVEVERELHSYRASAESRHKKQDSGPVASVMGSEEAELGPQTPPALHPGRAVPTADDPEAGHIVMAGGGLVAFNALRRDFEAMMQEFVQKKMELAELSEDYERVCHTFLKADHARNAPILAKLKRNGSLMRVSLNADAR